MSLFALEMYEKMRIHYNHPHLKKGINHRSLPNHSSKETGSAAYQPATAHVFSENLMLVVF